MDRIAKIQQYKINKDNEQIKKAQEKEKQIEDYKQQILSLSNRMNELLETGNACLKAGIKLSNSGGSTNGYSYKKGHFITEGWAHLTGFIPEYKNGEITNFKGFGKVGGGACNFNLLVLKRSSGEYFIDLSGKDQLYVLKTFLEGFDTFEKEFYDYVDKVVG